jgi:hypothetical protein
MNQPSGITEMLSGLWTRAVDATKKVVSSVAPQQPVATPQPLQQTAGRRRRGKTIKRRKSSRYTRRR